MNAYNLGPGKEYTRIARHCGPTLLAKTLNFRFSEKLPQGIKKKKKKKKTRKRELEFLI